jgi:Flp pilus assembly protein CpaB
VQYKRGRGHISVPYVLTVAIAFLVAAVLGARQIWRATGTSVVVAKSSMQPGEKIDGTKLVVSRVAKASVPAGATMDPQQLVGRVLQRPLAEGAVVTANDFAVANGGNHWLADAPPEGRVIMTLSVPGTLLPVRQLRLGDRLEVMAIDRNGSSRVVGRDVYYVGSMQSRPPTQKNGLESMVASAGGAKTQSGTIGLVIAVRPEDVAPIAQAETVRHRITFAVHGKREVDSGNMLEVDPTPTPEQAAAAQTMQVDLIAGARRERVDVR